MNQELLERLGRISPEEKGILAGNGRVLSDMKLPYIGEYL